MSRQSDLNNHANQLNPNNSAYYSSRYGSSLGDDDDGGGVVCTTRYYQAPRLSTVWTMEKEFEFTIVALNGQTSFARLRVSNSSSWSENSLYAPLEEVAIKAYHQLREGVARVSGSPVTYALLTVEGKTIEELKLWEPTAPAGWWGRWERVDRGQWQRLARTRSYRKQAIAARGAIDQAAAEIADELGLMATDVQGARATAISNAAMAFAGLQKVPLFRVAQLWQLAVERANGMDVADVVQQVIEDIPDFERALRTVDVLVRASNRRAPDSLRHPAVRGLGPRQSDEYDDYFGHKTCNDRIDQLDVWFTKGERRLRTLLSGLKSGRTRARFDLGYYDAHLSSRSPYISRELMERAMKPVPRASKKAR